MKFGQFMPYYKIKKSIIKFYKNCNLETSSRPFSVCKKIKNNLYWKMTFSKQPTYVRYVTAKPFKICPNQHADLLKFLFTWDFLKNKKGVELVSSHIFLKIFR